MKAFASLLLIAWLVPHEIAVIWQGGAAGVELRALAGDAHPRAHALRSTHAGDRRRHTRKGA